MTKTGKKSEITVDELAKAIGPEAKRFCANEEEIRKRTKGAGITIKEQAVNLEVDPHNPTISSISYSPPAIKEQGSRAPCFSPLRTSKRVGKRGPHKLEEEEAASMSKTTVASTPPDCNLPQKGNSVDQGQSTSSTSITPKDDSHCVINRIIERLVEKHNCEISKLHTRIVELETFFLSIADNIDTPDAIVKGPEVTETSEWDADMIRSLFEIKTITDSDTPQSQTDCFSTERMPSFQDVQNLLAVLVGKSKQTKLTLGRITGFTERVFTKIVTNGYLPYITSERNLLNGNSVSLIISAICKVDNTKKVEQYGVSRSSVLTALKDAMLSIQKSTKPSV